VCVAGFHAQVAKGALKFVSDVHGSVFVPDDPSGASVDTFFTSVALLDRKLRQVLVACRDCRLKFSVVFGAAFSCNCFKQQLLALKKLYYGYVAVGGNHFGIGGR
jgi:hypothetical protein